MRHFCRSNQGFVLAFLNDPDERPPIAARGRPIDGRDRLRTIPGAAGVPAAQSGAARSAPARPPTSRGNSPTRFPASTPTRFTPSADKLMAKLSRIPRISVRQLRSLQSHAESADRHPARPGQALRRLGDAHPHSAAQRLLAELQLSDQEGERSVPGDSGSSRHRPLRARRSGPALHQERRRAAPGAAERGDQLAFGARAAVGEPHQPVHQRHDLLQPEAGLRHRRGHAVCGETRASRFCRRASAAALQGEALTFQRHGFRV